MSNASTSVVEIEFTFRNVGGAAALKDYALRRLGGVVHSLPNLRSASVKVTFEQARPSEWRYVVEVTVAAKRALLRVEEHGRDPRTTIDLVHDPLKRRIRDWKGKVYFGNRREHAALKQALELEATRPVAEDNTGQIVRLKSHAAKPMIAEEAIEQMELLGHDFFLFLNSETEQHNVVYRRRAGDYGVIEPAVDRK